MTVILTPALALRYLRELSTDVRAAAVLDADGRLLAGDGALEAPARELLSALDDLAGAGGRELIVRVEEGGEVRGSVVVARSAGAGAAGSPLAAPGALVTPAPPAAAAPRALVVAVGPCALLDLLRDDLATVLGDLAGESADGPEDSRPLPDPLPATLAQVTAIDASRRVQAPKPADSAGRTAIFAAAEMLAASEAS
ncbi:hypothetical protein [Conexibacter woesei]|uniref:Roadblock/LC7 family protein n=1 Tax=Conexibacter woesei (strain DSM 14684 / CCUG 47730 / CIP 108061 / JCM 11494 / NBRC 100937 / ID131577) TaxID=469383 RepID=D3F315_CONWI|nr:hypothetical protein [Conexibacter woesei]ADB50295.1 hypothetical protein Cwoe_1869 [Conexibacter woesei DSM 14684]